MSGKLRVAILSAWHVHADEYTEAFAKHKDSEVVVVWDDNAERGAEFAKKHNVPFEPNLDTLLKRDDIDAVSCTTSTNLHKEVLIKVAKAGKHIFTEKVLAFTTADALEIKKAVVDSKVKFCISFPQRTMPHNLFAKKIIEDKTLGDITLMRVRNAHNGATAGWLPPHFYDKTVCGGGSMMDLGAHPMYLLNYLMGDAKTVSSTFTTFTNKPVDDNAVSVATYANGAIAISETGFVSSSSPFTLELNGTKGSLLIYGYDNAVKVIAPDLISGEINGTIEVGLNQLPKALPCAIDQFLSGILNNTEIHFGIDDAVALTGIMEAAYKSADQNGAAVSL